MRDADRGRAVTADVYDAASALPGLIDGVRIRYADSADAPGADGPADQSLAGERVRVRARVGSLARRTPGSSPLTCRASALRRAEMTCSHRRLWASSWSGSLPMRKLARRTSSRRRPHPAALFAAAAHPDAFASVIVGAGGAAVPIQLGEPLASWVSTPTSTSTASWTPAGRRHGRGAHRRRDTDDVRADY